MGKTAWDGSLYIETCSNNSYAMQTPMLRDFCFDSEQIWLKIMGAEGFHSRRRRELSLVSALHEDDRVLARPARLQASY
jgi:hypothetical protein